MNLTMGDSQTDQEKNLTTEDYLEVIASEDEDDYENYFLQPTGDNLNIAEKIAEANKKLFYENEEKKDDINRPKKVQFSEDLVNFEPSYCSDEELSKSARNSILSEEDSELKLIPEELYRETEEEQEELSAKSFLNYKIVSKESLNDEIDEIIEEIDEDFEDPQTNVDQILEENNNEKDNKLLLVLLPKELNSSCESIICENESEITVGKLDKKIELENLTKPKIARPKSAIGLKHKKCCEVSKVSPVLDYSSDVERKSWQVSQNLLSKSLNKVFEKQKKNKNEIQNSSDKLNKVVKKVNIGNIDENYCMKREEIKRCCDNRPKSSYFLKNNVHNFSRPNTAPIQRTCCVLKSNLPQYNGLRSEYGLSAQQLKERKQATIQIKNKKKQNQLKERQEELRKLHLNEESFQKWLLNKNKKRLSRSPIKTTDTLTRSDAFIQAHASYATNHNVPYSIDYCYKKKLNSKAKEMTAKKSKNNIIVEKLLKEIPSQAKKSFNIYLGIRQ